MLLLVCTYIIYMYMPVHTQIYIHYVCMFVYVLACIFTDLHIFLLSVNGKEWDEGRECEKGRVNEGEGNELLQSEFLFLFNFMVAKGFF